MSNKKYQILAISIVMDAIGMSSIAIPVIGPISDLAWAPFSLWVMTRLYPGQKGKMAGTLAFIEEILPGTDIIPTFTLTWLYTYVWKGSKNKNTSVIEVK